MAVNHTVLQGRMVADPELKDTNNGAKVVNFRVAWSEKYKERETKCFLECKAFSGTAEFVCNYFRKGQELTVESKTDHGRMDDAGRAETEQERTCCGSCTFLREKAGRERHGQFRTGTGGPDCGGAGGYG